MLLNVLFFKYGLNQLSKTVVNISWNIAYLCLNQLMFLVCTDGAHLRHLVSGQSRRIIQMQTLTFLIWTCCRRTYVELSRTSSAFADHRHANIQFGNMENTSILLSLAGDVIQNRLRNCSELKWVYVLICLRLPPPVKRRSQDHQGASTLCLGNALWLRMSQVAIRMSLPVWFAFVKRTRFRELGIICWSRATVLHP